MKWLPRFWCEWTQPFGSHLASEQLEVAVPKTCTVIGGGLIATAGAWSLERAGCKVTTVTRAPAPLSCGGIDWRYGDVESETAAQAMTHAESVIYAAGTLSPATQIENVHAAITDNVVPVLKLADLAARAGARNFVFISSGGTVYGPDAPLPTPETAATTPINTYGMVKVVTEQALLEIGRKLGLTVVILRISNPYGPGQTGTRGLGFVAAAVRAAIARQPIVIWGNGQATRDFVFIDDVGAALALAAGHVGKSVTLNIGSGEERSLLQVCSLASCHAPSPLAIKLEMGRAFDVPRSCLAIARANDTLGWRPRMQLDDGIRKMIAGHGSSRNFS